MYKPLDELFSGFAPAERGVLSDWAEKHFVLSPEYSAKTGALVLDSWQRGIFDSYTDPAVWQIVLMCATQMVKTLFLQVTTAYDICGSEPGPILFVAYKDSDGEKFSRDRFSPMERDIPEIAARMKQAKGRAAIGKRQAALQPLLHKSFRGGKISFVGSLAPANLGAQTIRYLKMDEVDRYDASSGKEGHACDLALRRTDRFGSRRKVIFASSPTIRGESKIGELFDDTDRMRGFVGCHKCGYMQILFWNQIMFDSKASISDAAAGARFQCAQCGELWTDQQRKHNIREAFEWRPTNPEQLTPETFQGRRGFQIGHQYSLLALHSLSEMTRLWLEAKDNREKRKVFINTDLSELWEEEGERPQWERIQQSAEVYEMGSDAVLPEQVVMLIAGTDVQQKRLETQVLGFGIDEESNLNIWVVDYQVIELFEPQGGSGKMTSAPEYWKYLADIHEHQYQHPSGVALPILVHSIDVGHNPDPVYTFAQRYPQPTHGPLGLQIHSPGTVLCIRGYDSEALNAIRRVTERETARTRKGPGHDLPIITLGTGFLKTELYSRLTGRADLKQLHISAALNADYFRGIVAEKRVVSTQGDVSWEKIYPRNEPLDTFVYAMGGFYALKADRFDAAKWQILRRKMGIPETSSEIAARERHKPTAVRPRLVRSSYLADNL